MIRFLVMDTLFAYNVILGRPGLNLFQVVVSTYHSKMKFPTKRGIGEVSCDQKEARKCYNLSLKKGTHEEKMKRKEKEEDEVVDMERLKKLKAERIDLIEEHKSIELIPGEPNKATRIRSRMNETLEAMTIEFLRKNADMFAWDPSDFKGYVSEVQYTEWLANVVVVPKASGKWRMCTEFTDLNKDCRKDPHPLPRIDLLVDSTVGCELFSMMDAYQGYPQIFMAEEDRVKTSFITENGIYCYNGKRDRGKPRKYRGDHTTPISKNAEGSVEANRPDASGRLVKWAVELGEHDIEYQGRTSIKAQVLADFIMEFASEQIQEKEGGWLLHVNGSSNASNGEAGVLLQGPNEVEIEVAARLSFATTKNEAEYEALLLGLQLAYEAGARELDVCTDSQLVAMQIKGAYETRERTMMQYLAKVKKMIAKFGRCVVQQIPRNENERADALSKFGAMVLGVKNRKVTIMIKECLAIEEVIEVVLISDSGKQFQLKAIMAWCKELKIQQNFMAVGNRQANGQTEVTNRMILEHLKTRIEGAKGLTEAIIPTEIGEETQRIAQYDAVKNREGRACDLTVIEEKRDGVYPRILHHKGLMMRSYNQKVKSRCFQVGDRVLKKVEVSKHVGKLDPGWEGPFKVIEVKKPGTYRLQDMEGKDLSRP
ncbi:UNVERIFIED_CONTAM: hypothetical protein Slati_2257300 [Sesamum latifolium]|uniref:RNase H type-1 domain-containing protein n=1 Tax=Sesamum latifolium TaxID=2727402 RepID=A0AAW2WZF5_9LAMI